MRAAAALAALLLPAVLRAAPLEVSVDSRIELLAAVSYLAGTAREGADVAAYRAELEKRFGSLRGHPAVSLYRTLASEPGGEEACATFLLYYGPPPELTLLDPAVHIHYLEGRVETMQRLLWELRDFARVSRFEEFRRDRAAADEAAVSVARERLGDDPVPDVEAFLGLGLSSRARYYLAPLARSNRAFIIPYPLPPSGLGARRLDVYTLPAGPASSFTAATVVWNEPLYAFLDPAVHHFERLAVKDRAAYYGKEFAACRAVSPSCVHELVTLALIDRLERRRGRPAAAFDAASYPSPRDRRALAALSARLDEYEADRRRWPDLWTFLPRLMSVFHELAHGGRSAPPAPELPAVARVADFLDPGFVRRNAP